MEKIIEAIKKIWEAYMATDLPKDTVDFFVKVCQQCVDLLKEYANVIFK